MRPSLFIAAAVLLSATLAPMVSRASDDVLLPSNSGSGAGMPNLGLDAAPPQSVSDKAATSSGQPPAKTAQPALDNTAASPDGPATILDNAGSLDESATTPQPVFNQAVGNQTPPEPTVPPPLQPSDIVSSPVSAQERAKLPPGEIPTTIIHQPVATDASDQSGAALPHKLTVTISKRSIFGATDVQKIGAKLGLRRRDIFSSCILAAQGVMQTDKGTYLLVGQASPQAEVNYDGMIRNYMMTGVALCAAKAPLPPGSGFLTEIGDRFSIPLQAIHCPPPDRQVTGLTITYDGSDTSQCDYQ